jgi:hypothetical protein
VTVADVAPTVADHLGFTFHAADGLSLAEAVGPTGAPPRVVVVVVWDGVGRNVLAHHAGAWPVLRGLLDEGAWYRAATLGSSPSVTAAVHATIGTGAFPSTHGRVANRFRLEGSMVAMEEAGPHDLLVPTLADLWDRSVGNRARVGLVAYREWHLGMLGHGAAFPGGDHDVAILMDEDTGRWALPEREHASFRFAPPAIGGVAGAIRRLDAADGRRDGRWLGENLDDPAVALASPAYAGWQAGLLRGLIAAEGFGADPIPDLLFTNYKQADLVSHRWGMESPRMGQAIGAMDRALGELIGALDDLVGRGRWVLALTADHGSTPPPASTGATVIDESALVAAIRARFDRDGDGRSVLLALSPSQAWLDRTELEDEGVTTGAVARFIAGYGVDGERPFAGAFPSRLLSRPRCAEP